MRHGIPNGTDDVCQRGYRLLQGGHGNFQGCAGRVDDGNTGGVTNIQNDRDRYRPEDPINHFMDQHLT